MGWIATVAGTLIAIMFAYNWLYPEKLAGPVQEVDVKSKVPILCEEQSGEQASPEITVPTFATKVESPISPRDKDAKSTMDGRLASPSPAPTIIPPLTEEKNTHMSAPTPRVMPPPPPPARSKSPPRLKPPTTSRPPASGLAPPPTAPRPGGSTLRPPPSSASSLRVPPQKILSNASMIPSSSTLAPSQKPSRQVILEPGHSPLDWAALTSNPANKLRGKDAPPTLMRVTPSRLKSQNGRRGKDAWTVYQGRVYNVTPYVPFHPGGKGELLRGAGKDSAKLFMEVHPWVNWDGMLGECCVGILVGEEEAEENSLDEMD